MKARMALGLLGLAIVGCAQPRSAKSVASRPVGMDPVPSLHDTINRGTGDPALRQATLSDAKNPNWSGRFAPPQAARHTAQLAGGPARPATGEQPPALPPAVAPVLASPSSPPIGNQAQAEPALAEPATIQPPVGGGSIEPAAAPAPAPAELPPIDEPAVSPPTEPLPPAAMSPSSGPASFGSGMVSSGSRPRTQPAGSSPTDAIAAGYVPVEAAPEPLPTPAPARPAAPTASVFGSVRNTAPVSAAPEMPLESSPEPPSNPQPVQSIQAVPTMAPPLYTTPSGPSASASPARPKKDAAVGTASYVSTNAMEVAVDREWREAGRSAARVGDEVITLHDLVFNVKEQLKRNPPGRSLTRDELNMVAKSVLGGLIERTLIVQEAKRVLKNPKQLDRLKEAADKYWREEELPPMMRRHSADNELQLRQKLLESGRSLDSLRVAYHQEFIAQVFLEQKFADRRKVELPEMLGYYQRHLNDKEFHRNASITWRELVVEKGRHPKPGEAKQKADDLLAKLQRGEDFAKLAKNESEGPTREREEGGLLQTAPGSYAVESVNQALGTLPLNQVSPILEGPSSLHIVRVEARRQAGPATFEEIQDQIRRKILIEKMTKARVDFMTKLRRDTLVSTIFDGTESDPAKPMQD